MGSAGSGLLLCAEEAARAEEGAARAALEARRRAREEQWRALWLLGGGPQAVRACHTMIT